MRIGVKKEEGGLLFITRKGVRAQARK